MDIEKSSFEKGEGIKFEKKEVKEKVKETLLAIRESIEEARRPQEENPEERIPRLIWGRRRLEENDPDYEKKAMILERVFKKLGVDFTKETAQDLNFSLYQTKVWGEWVEEEKSLPGKRESISTEIWETNEPGVVLIKNSYSLLNEQREKVRIAEYSLFINLEKESK